MSTPLDRLDIPDGVMFEIRSTQFLWRENRHRFSSHARESAQAHVAWCMATANCRSIQIIIEPARGWTSTRVVIDMTRPHNLAPWECPQVPEWQEESPALASYSVVGVAEEILRGYQRGARG